MMNQRQLDYAQENPDYCRLCDGFGEVQTMTMPNSLIACPGCLVRGKCPRCGKYTKLLRNGQPRPARNGIAICSCDWQRGDGMPI